MQKLTIKLDYIEYPELEIKNYLLTIKGIELITVKDLEIYLEYNEKLINSSIIKLEILFFINSLNIPSIIGFNKHFNKKTKGDFISITNNLCEYCLKNKIETLFNKNEIESAYLFYEDCSSNAIIKYTFDDNITSLEIKEIINSYK